MMSRRPYRCRVPGLRMDLQSSNQTQPNLNRSPNYRRGPDDQNLGRRTNSRGGGAHIRSRCVGRAGRPRRRSDQDRTRQPWRRDAWARLDRRGHHGGRCPRAARALEPGQAEPRPRSGAARRPRGALQARGHLRRVPHEQTAASGDQAAHRRRRHPGRQPEHDLRPWHRARPPRARRRQGLVRLVGLLGQGRNCLRSEAAGGRQRHQSTGAGVRRLDRRDHDRRSDHGGAVPS